MIAIEVRGLEELDRRLAGLGADLSRAQERAVREASLLVNRRLKERMSDPGGSDPFWGRIGGAGDTLAARSGQSRARISPGGQVLKAGNRAFAFVGSPDRHVAFLEEGGTIARARIPTAAAQTEIGVGRYIGVGLKSIPGGFFLRSRAGNLWGAIRQGRRLVLLFLYKAVTIRGRHVFQRTREQVEPEVRTIAEREIALAVRRASGG